MRIISFAWTTEAFLNGNKTVTRRMWKEQYVKEGDLMQAWDKSPRAHGKRVGTIRITNIDHEPLNEFATHGDDEVKREGGYWKDADEFIDRFLKGNPGMKETDKVWRLEFERYMEKRIVVIARANHIDKQGDVFSLECLKRIAEANPPQMISRSFDQAAPPVGRVEHIFVEGQELKAGIMIDPYMLESHVFRPGGLMISTHQTTSDGKSARMIDKMDLADIGAVERGNDVY